jgi:SAM-dependent methyltransferase
MTYDPGHYAGGELELFAHATNWKRYWASCVKPHIRGDVLEVGAGIGNNTLLLRSATPGRWTCLEPDAKLLARIESDRARGSLPGDVECLCGTLGSLDAHRTFDTILYLDVLEHIPGDSTELHEAAQHLNMDGTLMVLSPAHPAIFSAFDEAVGHYRRYDRASLCAAAPQSLRLVLLAYLDCIGLLASSANRLMLKQSVPTLRQIRLWDRCMIPISRFLDPLFLHRIGKSVLGIWRQSI